MNRSPNAFQMDTARFNYTFPSQGRLDFDAYEMKEEESSEMKDKIAALEGMKALERLEARKKRSDIQRKMDETRKELEFLKVNFGNFGSRRYVLERRGATGNRANQGAVDEENALQRDEFSQCRGRKPRKRRG